MKLKVFLLALLLSTGHICNGQSGRKTWVLSGNLDGTARFHEQIYVNANFEPRIAHYITRRILLGLDQRHELAFDPDFSLHSGLGPYMRYYTKKKGSCLFLEARVLTDVFSDNSIVAYNGTPTLFWSAGPGYSIYIKDNVAMEWMLRYNQSYENAVFGLIEGAYLDFSIGFSVYITRPSFRDD